MNRPAISTAKITRPVQTEIYQRERLFTVLDECLNRPVTWVTGPGGSGKTTLVSSYIDSRKLPCLWYQADQGDADLATFFYYLGQAARQAAPRRKTPLPLLTREYLLGITEFTHHYFEELFSRMKSPALLVLDDYQNIPEGSDLNQVIMDALTRLPVGINIVIISRLGPVPAFSRLRANRQLELVGWDELRLSMDEFTDIAATRETCKLPKAALRKLYHRLDGWVAGLILMLEKSRVMGGKLEPLEEITPDEIFDYFAEEIIRKIDPEYRDFYFRTSFLPRMTPEMAEKITGNHRARQILNYLHTNHVFTEKHERSPPYYQYHPLFREFLQTRFADQYGRDAMRNLQRDGADILVEHGMYEDAAGLYSRAQDWIGLKKLILLQAGDMVNQGRHQALMDWICRVPEEDVAKDPWVDYWLGVCRTPYDPPEARANLTRAYSSFLDREDSEGTFLSWSRIVETYITEWSDFTPLDHWIEELDRILEHFGDFPTRDAEARAVMGMFSALMYRQPAHPKIMEWEERTRTLMTTTTDRHHQVILANQLLHFYSWMGSLPKGGLVLKGLRNRIQVRDVGISPLARIFVHALDAMYDCFTGSFDTSMEAVEKGLREAEATGVHVWDEMLIAYGTYGALSTGRLDAARDLLQRMGNIINYGRMLLAAQYYFLATWEALCRGDLQAAGQNVDSGLALTRSAGHPYAEAILHIGKAQTLIETGDHNLALRHLGEARRIVLAGQDGAGRGTPLIDYMCLINESYVAVLQGKERKAAQLIRRTMALGRKFGFVSVPGGQSSVMSVLCARALAEGIETDYVTMLIRKRNLEPTGDDTDMASWPWPVRLFTLGRFEIVLDGTPLRSSGKAQSKPLTLLKALVASGGRDVPEERITDILWPDADGDMAHRSFATTLHRLRRLIGQESLRLTEGRLSLNPSVCRLDLLALESAMDRAAAAQESDEGSGRALELAEKALRLYEGEFLPGDGSEPWVLAVRERLSGRYTRILKKHCQTLEKEGRTEAAIEWYERALELDGASEEVYQQLMSCYLRTGRRSDGIALYRRCRKVLEESLGVPPSARTEKILRQLQSGDEKPY